MIIAITGQPGSGKSTLLNSVRETDRPVWGFLAESIVSDNTRTGFLLKAEDGTECVLASTDIPNGPKVSRYRVDLDGLDNFLKSLRDPQEGELIYLDEVGQMEMYSELMEPLVINWLEKAEDIIIVVSEVFKHPLIDSIISQADVLIEVTEENRLEKKEQLTKLISKRRL
jgi:nucleoside-triphosphatase THEP1